MGADQFPITLESTVFTRMVVISIQVEEGLDEVVPPENDLKIKRDARDKNRYFASVNTKLNPEGKKNCLYTIDMECVGVFRVEADADEAIRTRGIAIVAHNVLYGAIREAVSWITGRQANGPIMLGLSILQPDSKHEVPVPDADSTRAPITP
jgi:hypothetical protein